MSEKKKKKNNNNNNNNKNIKKNFETSSLLSFTNEFGCAEIIRCADSVVERSLTVVLSVLPSCERRLELCLNRLENMEKVQTKRVFSLSFVLTFRPYTLTVFEVGHVHLRADQTTATGLRLVQTDFSRNGRRWQPPCVCDAAVELAVQVLRPTPPPADLSPLSSSSGTSYILWNFPPPSSLPCVRALELPSTTFSSLSLRLLAGYCARL